MITLSKDACPNTCPYFDTCDNKVMVVEGLIDKPMVENASLPTMADFMEPVMRETMQINVYGHQMTVYKDDIERMIYEPLTRHFGLMSGA